MKKSRKPLIITAVCFIIAGLMVCTGVMVSLGFDFTKLDNTPFVETTYEFSEEITDIVFDTDTADIRILPAKDNKTKLVCYENEKDKHLAAVKDGTLYVTKDEKEWYDHIHIGFTFRSPQITLYLSEEEYNSIRIDSSTGDTDISDITANGININSSTGDTTLINLNLTYLIIDVSTGEIEINRTICKNNMSLDTSTGDITFINSDADTISAETSTGDISGTLLTDKTFDADTSTGDIDIPHTTGKLCYLRTSTGDIEIRIAE